MNKRPVPIPFFTDDWNKRDRREINAEMDYGFNSDEDIGILFLIKPPDSGAEVTGRKFIFVGSPFSEDAAAIVPRLMAEASRAVTEREQVEFGLFELGNGVLPKINRLLSPYGLKLTLRKNRADWGDQVELRVVLK